MFHADLHIHSRFSRACSRDCDVEHLAWWALRKGITVVGTGDFTHPAWAAELRESLIPAEPGLLRLRPDLENRLRKTSARTCVGPVRFMLSAEISTIYRGGDRTRKVHHLIYAPDFEAADRITLALAKIGNLASDGRPIIGLDSRSLLEITLTGGVGCYLVPAHAWTPWFAVLGSKSGFDRVADCYGDLAGEVFAIETGLSSDPPMNWMCSSLDGYRLLSNSDAHSPPMLGREATSLTCDLDYFEMAKAFRTGDGLAGTIEFFPEEGKYHLDGHRKCGVRLDPARDGNGREDCPTCGKPLTIGVAHRVAELADRLPGYRPPGAPGFTRLVQLRQVVSEIVGIGPQSKKVTAEVSRLVAALGPELRILRDVPCGDIQAAGGGLLAEAVARLRRGSVQREGGYDGEYGTVRLFSPDELRPAETLFDLAPRRTPAAHPVTPKPVPAGKPVQPAEPVQPAKPMEPAESVLAGKPVPVPALDRAPGLIPRQRGSDPASRLEPEGLLSGLDSAQRAAVLADSPLMIVAGPGTGKTRTLTHRIAWQLAARGLPAEGALAVTFTRRAADEMRTRLAALAGPDGRRPDADHLSGATVTTFHGLGLKILRELHAQAGLPADFAVADEAASQELAAELAGSEVAGRELLASARTAASAGTAPRARTRGTAGTAAIPGTAGTAAREALVEELTARGLVDFDGLIELPAALLAAEPALAARLRARWPLISVDEYQDIDAAQYELLRLLAGDGAGLTAIGDPDQAIYGFRGADVGFFLRFGTDYPAATTAQLGTSYRSGRPIVAAAMAAIAPATLLPGRTLAAVSAGPPVTARGVADEHAEAAWIAATIDQLLGGASFHSIDSGRASSDGQAGLSLADFAVLYRTDAQSAAIGQALTRAGLPFRKGSHDLLQRRTGVPEIVRELRLAGSATAAGPAIPEAGSPAAGPAAAATPVTSLLAAAVRRLTAVRPGRLAVDVLAAGELLMPLARRCGTDLERFAADVATGAAVDALDPRADAVTLLTLHAAKGLEFEVVFLAGCEAGLLPLRLPGAARGAREGGPAAVDPAEERRLLFVGMTRARSRLLISHAATRTRNGATVTGGPSPFLNAINPVLLEQHGQAPRRRPAQRQLRLL